MGRRKKGYRGPEGLIRIKKSQNWYIKKSVYGKDVFKSTGTSDLMLAQAIFHEVMRELLRENHTHSVNKILGKSVFLKDVVERYLIEISPNKAENGRNDINASKPILEYFRDCRIDNITQQDVYKYLDSRAGTISKKTGRFINGASINREKSFLSQIFTKSIRWGYITINIVKGLEGFSENRRERYLSDDEFLKILSHLKLDHQDLFLTLYHTSLRPNRGYNLKWSQINLKARSIEFTKKPQKTSSHSTPQNKNVPDMLFINDALHQILTKRKKNRRTLSPYVFYKPSLKPYSQFDARKIWLKAAEKGAVTDTRPRDLRHKSITDMRKAKNDTGAVAKVAGHKDERTTQIYTHFTIEDTMEPLQALAKKRFIRGK